MEFDCVLYQSLRGWRIDQHELLSEAQRQLPRIFLEHDPPQEHPTNTRHPVDDPEALLVHVTHFNQLMWDSGRTPTAVIEHGVLVPESAAYSGELERGIVVVNHLQRRGRRLGHDVFDQVRKQVPLDLVGMAAEEAGGLGEIANVDLPAFVSRYRFFFHPIRYTSLGLALIEAMLCGVPVVGLATTELPTVIENGRTGFIDTDIGALISAMQALLRDRGLAAEVGAAGQRYARERFGIERFTADWNAAFARVCS